MTIIHSDQLIKGYPPFHKVYNTQHKLSFTSTFTRHVNAANLDNIDALTLMKIHSLSSHDKTIWNSVYNDEYDGLCDLSAWTSISEYEYKRLRPTLGSSLPTMAISTIKYDENGSPQRAEWYIVTLGHIDPHA